ncbi:Ig-like domain-containing protein, partial [Volucribacter psittacicida]|uniref:Ig-like domain-containing protein n=1 Tax=Volucribacter psittacicida TaxID=203482 RepID=UPI00140241E8
MTKSITLKINSSKDTIKTIKLEKNQQVKIQAQEKVNYQFIDDETEFAPENIMIKREGDDLLIAFEGTEIETPNLIIENYYQVESDNLLIGQYENGEIYPYVPESGLKTDAVTELSESTSAGQALGGEPIKAVWAISPWLLALIPLAGIGIGAAAKGHSKKHNEDTPNTHIDTKVPSITVDAPDLTNDNTPTITGTTDAPVGSTVTVTITDKNGDTQTVTTTVKEGGSYEVEVPEALPEGEYKVTVEVTDPAGNKGDNNGKGTIDTTAPTVTISLDKIAGDDVVNKAESEGDITITGEVSGEFKAGDTVTVSVDGNSYTTTVDAEGHFSVEIPGSVLAGAGTPTVTASIRTQDSAGNPGSGSTSRDYTVDVTKPSITVEVPENTNDSTPTIKGETDAPAGSTVTVTIIDKEDKTQTVTTTVKEDGSYEVEVPEALPEGEYKVTVEVTDPAGNKGDNNG